MSSTKNIAKNSLFLYLRMFVNMVVSLFTAGIVLNTLGITDYGIYSIVGGFVSMFGFLNTSMSSATQRFLSFDLGKNDLEQLRKTFSTTVTIHLAIALLIVLCLETFGLWYINNKLNVPVERLGAVNIVYQFSVFSAFFTVVQVPYNALITAHERFNVFAYISFLDIFFKLIILFLIRNINFDKLVLYAGLLFVASFIIRMIYRIYCRSNFVESRYKFYFEKSYFKVMLSFTGWNLFGNIADVARGQGNNLLLNFFYGTTINAASGIAMQVQNFVKIFITSFQKAVNPQIVKSYAKNDLQHTIFLMKESARLSFFLMSLVAMPVLFNIHFVLTLWLKKFPEQTIDFIYLSISIAMIETISNPLMMGAGATGKIKWYQIVIGTLSFMSLPLAYVGLQVVDNPNVVYASVLIMNFLTLYFRLFFLERMINQKVSDFAKEVLSKIFIHSILVFLWHYLMYIYIGRANSLLIFLLTSMLSVFGSSLILYFISLSSKEKEFIKLTFKKNIIK